VGTILVARHKEESRGPEDSQEDQSAARKVDNILETMEAVADSQEVVDERPGVAAEVARVEEREEVRAVTCSIHLVVSN
jgi:hypothetical protein